MTKGSRKSSGCKKVETRIRQFLVIFKHCVEGSFHFETKYYLTINVFFIFFCSQGIFAVFGRFVCSRGTSGGPEASSEEKGPGWLIIIAFTAIFLGTYPLHMYFAELYLQNDFTFLLAKYCVGFLYVVLIPFITLVAQREIRQGVVSILRSKNTSGANSGSCNALDEMPNVD